MPLPSPRDKETRNNFLKRCVLELGEKGEFPDMKQRAAVCYQQFDDASSKAAIEVQNPWNDEDLFYFFPNKD